MRKFSLHIFFTAMLAMSSVSYAASNVEQMDAKITARTQALLDDLSTIGDDLGSLIECGNESRLDGASGCRFIAEQNPNLAHYVKTVPVCAADEFLVKSGPHEMSCKLITDFDYENAFDPISGTTCSGVAPIGMSHCRCGNWVTEAQASAIQICSGTPTPPSYTGTWQTGAWSQCSVCVGNAAGQQIDDGFQRRTVSCVGGACDPAAKPAEEQACRSNSCSAPATGTWYWDGSREVGNNGVCSFRGTSCSPLGSFRTCCGRFGVPAGRHGVQNCLATNGNRVIDPVIYECRQ